MSETAKWEIVFCVFLYDKGKLHSRDFMRNAIFPLISFKSWYYMLLLQASSQRNNPVS